MLRLSWAAANASFYPGNTASFKLQFSLCNIPFCDIRAQGRCPSTVQISCVQRIPAVADRNVSETEAPQKHLVVLNPRVLETHLGSVDRIPVPGPLFQK